VRGAGLPLCCLHGFMGRGSSWGSHAAALEREFRVVVVDLPGHGRSGIPADAARASVERGADDLAVILAREHCAPAHVLGYSLGARSLSASRPRIRRSFGAWCSRARRRGLRATRSVHAAARQTTAARLASSVTGSTHSSRSGRRNRCSRASAIFPRRARSGSGSSGVATARLVSRQVSVARGREAWSRCTIVSAGSGRRRSSSQDRSMPRGAHARRKSSGACAVRGSRSLRAPVIARISSRPRPFVHSSCHS
jgi:Predicted hydrolases or acyltransferases (alpha/beta hydrolase superfamily)